MATVRLDAPTVSTVDRSSDIQFILPEKIYFRGGTHRAIPLIGEPEFNEKLLCQDDLTLLKFGLEYFLRTTPFIKSFWMTEFGIVLVTDVLTEYGMRIWRAINRLRLNDPRAPTLIEIQAHINHLSRRSMSPPSVYAIIGSSECPVLKRMHSLFMSIRDSNMACVDGEPESHLLLHNQVRTILDSLTARLPFFLEFETPAPMSAYTYVDRVGAMCERGEVIMYTAIPPLLITRDVDLWAILGELYAESCYWLLQLRKPDNAIELMDFIHRKTGYTTTTIELISNLSDRSVIIDMLNFLYELEASEFMWVFWTMI
ncbi:ORF61 [black bullhead herpesvirus]|uniref:ORF61 n=1 Tax=black bullhead herpesvirus TaxID=508441 RepID=D5FM49_9VIRU|nr:ORF61 [black bullhead herpesvirus]ACZ55876.1 ORF61 [black bullhead herpesvirus]